MHDAERHQRAKAIFLELLPVAPDARGPLLEQATAGDAALRSEVESLLLHAGDPSATAVGVAVSEGERPRFAAGDVFADRYRIIEELGRGANGEVYRALDTRLDVEIALKIVHGRSPAAIRRLRDEVRLARQITDPAVCRVYDIEECDGQHFLTMELVEGETLASLLARVGCLNAAKVRQIGIEILGGLAAAHARGILHRDLKPSNVMIDAHGSARVTDFGVASQLERAEISPFAGTPAFMAPEQLTEGAPASVQTDLYAVGLILYEALVGRLPALADASDAIVEKPSKLVPDVDPVLERVIMQLLARDPGARPLSARRAADDLGAANGTGIADTPPTSSGAGPSRASATTEWTTRARRVAVVASLVLLAGIVMAVGYVATTHWTPAQLGRPVWRQVTEAVGHDDDAGNVGIVVLPLSDETDRGDQGSLAEGIQRAIIERLEGMRELRVVGEDSSDRFGSKANLPKAARELGVSYVAAGRLRGASDDPEVELTLYEVQSGKPLWRERYDSPHSAPIPPDVEHRFVEHVSETLDIDADTGRDTALSAGIDASTYTLYLRGREHVPPYTEADFGAGVALLRQAVERNPGWAAPYAAIATAYVVACATGWVEPADGYPTARRYAEQAVTRDPALCEAHVALAIVAGEYDWDWASADDAYSRAVELCPGSAWAHRTRARFLSTQGRFDEALEATARAVELEPTSALMLQGAAQRFYEAGRYERAVALARIAKQLDPLYPYTYMTLGYALIEQGKYSQALHEFDRSMAVVGRNAADQVRRAYALARSGDQRAAVVAAQQARAAGTLDFNDRALLHLAEHDEPGSVAVLAEAVEKRAAPSVWLAVSPLYASLHGRDDFRALVAKVGLTFPQR